MKITELREELRKADDAQLRDTVQKLRKQLFTLRVNSSTTHVKDYSQFGKLRQSIARILTELRSRQAQRAVQE